MDDTQKILSAIIEAIESECTRIDAEIDRIQSRDGLSDNYKKTELILLNRERKGALNMADAIQKQLSDVLNLPI